MKILYYLFIILFMYSGVSAQKPEWIVWNTSNSDIGTNNLMMVTIDSSGNVFLANRYADSIERFDGKDFYAASIKYPYNLVQSNLGTLWAMSLYSGIYWIESDTAISVSDKFPVLKGDTVLSMVSDSNGYMWFLSLKHLFKYDGSSWFTYDLPANDFPKVFQDYKNSRFHNTKYPMVFDNIGNLWIGTFGSGLWKFDGYYWTNYNKKLAGLPADTITALAVDVNNNLWAGYIADTAINNMFNDNGGLLKFDGVKWTYYNKFNSGLPNPSISSIAVDKNGDLFIGMNNFIDYFSGSKTGLVRFDGSKTWERLYPPVRYDNVQSMTIDRKGNKWLATLSGLVAYKKNGVEGYDKPFTKPRPVVPKIICGSKTITLYWQSDTLPNIVYKIYRSYSSNPGELVLYADNIKDTFFIDKGLSYNRTYYYSVKAYDTLHDNFQRKSSNYILSGEIIGIPATPTNLIMACGNINTIYWNGSSSAKLNNTIYHRVYRSKNPYGGYRLIKDSIYADKYNYCYFTDPYPVKNENNYYHITAYFPESQIESKPSDFTYVFTPPVETWSDWFEYDMHGSYIIRALYFKDKKTGWAGTYSGEIIFTSDSGNSWKSQVSNLEFPIRQIQFTDSTTGWAVSSSYNTYNSKDYFNLLRTTDQGTSWLSIAKDDQIVIGSFSFVDNNTGWISGYSVKSYSGIILKTKDSGKTWDTLKLPYWSVYKLKVFNDSSAFAIMTHDSGFYHDVYYTSDGGKTWLPKTSGSYIYDFNFFDQNHGWAVGYNKIYMGGCLDTSWTECKASGQYALNSVQFVDDKKGWAAGYYGDMLKTTDGGLTWKEVSCKKTYRTLYSVAMLDEYNGWAGGDSVMLHTFTGGENLDAPLAIKNLLINGDSSGVNIQWDKPYLPPGADEDILYTIYRSPSSEHSYRIICEIDGNTKFKDVSPDVETSYNYFVNAVFKNRTKASPNSDTAAGWLMRKPLPPWNLSYTYNSKIESIILKWEKSPTPNVVYIVSRKSGVDQEFSSISTEMQDAEFTYKVEDEKSGIFAVQAKGNVSGLLSNYSDNLKIDLTGIEKDDPIITEVYPNPFSESTVISYDLISSGYVRLTIYNSLGEIASVPANGIQDPGRYQILVNAAGLAPGIYFYELKTEDNISKGKFVITK